MVGHLEAAKALGAIITEIKIAGVTCYRIDPKEVSKTNEDRLLVHLHGALITKTGDSYYVNADVDNLLGKYEGFIEESLKLYSGGRDMKDPYLSPVYGDMSGFPPTVLISGTRDLLLSNTVRVHRKLRAAGVKAELHVYEGQSHADYLQAFSSPEGQDAMKEIAVFFDQAMR